MGDRTSNISFLDSESFDPDLAPEEFCKKARERLERAHNAADSLATLAEAPTFDNFLLPLDRVLLSVRNVDAHATLLSRAHSDGEVRAAGTELMTDASSSYQSVLADRRLIERLERLRVDQLDQGSIAAVSRLKFEMRSSGDGAQEHRGRIAALHGEIDALADRYRGYLAKGSVRLMLGGEDSWEGLPAGFIEKHPIGPDGMATVALRPSETTLVLEHAHKAATRRKLQAALDRSPPENVAIFREILAKRTELARLLGYPNFATFVLQTRLLDTPEKVMTFLESIRLGLRESADSELAQLKSIQRRNEGAEATLERGDELFYLRMWREGAAGTDRSDLREFFSYDRVRDGLFELAGELFGLTFVRLPEAPVWAVGVEAYEVLDEHGILGRCYLDPLPRPGKFPGGVMAPTRFGAAGAGAPEGALIMPLIDASEPGPEPKLPHAKVVGFFHEFGHLLHHLLAGRQRLFLNTFEGIQWDFVEVPSKLFEELAWDPEILNRIAVPGPDGTRLPVERLAKGREAADLGIGLRQLRTFVMAIAALQIYSGSEGEPDAGAVIERSFRDLNVFPTSAGSHLEANSWVLVSYTASQYAYLLGAILAKEILAPFRERGRLLDPQLARRFADLILAPGGSCPSIVLVETYLARPVNTRAGLS